ncbi:uncharacterized protein LOC125075375 [Vanessa atalanta]|uniref:uncharacterized protein LOC125075375 n=1 Tax=Vanessa atalanta TaxID=42275 RepID=UPI001FCDCC50|nr:uncharacterized protein LOC125075375 [Vanessa atalanta]
MSRLDMFTLGIFLDICLFTFSEGQKYEIMPQIMKKSPKYDVHRIQANGKVHRARKSNTFDYDYEDWEDKAPDYINFYVNASDSTTDTQTQADTSPTNIPDIVTDLTSSIDDIQLINQTETLQDTIATNTETILETQSVTFTAASTVATSPSTSYIPEFPDFTEDIFQKSTITVPTTSKPARNRLLNELILVKKETREGYFTAGLVVALKKLSEKEPDDLKNLIVGLHHEVTRLNNLNKLAMLGPIVQQTFTSMVYVATLASTEALQIQSQNGVGALQNRREDIAPDWNAILDIADTIYEEGDLHDLANFLRDLQDYPKNNKQPIDIASDAIKVLIFMPYERIEGTAKDKLLRLEIQNAVKQRLEGSNYMGGRRQVGDGVEDKTSTNRYMKEMVKFDLRTKEPTSSTVYMEYARNATIMKRLRHKMKLYKEKFKIINQKERGSSRRGPTTTTTTTTTTTPKPPMRKSKYYIRKYVKKDLYKMTTTTKKTTTFRIRYYGKIRKFNIDGDNFDLKHAEPSNGSNDSEGYYSDTEYNNDKQADISLESAGA